MTEQNLDALIFIDTNILLDFYRIRNTNISLNYLSEIESNKDRLILTNQVEMEFRKNRQKVILEALGEVKKISAGNIGYPAILLDDQPVKMIKKAKKQIEVQQKKITVRLDKILNSPGTHDKVFQTVQRVYKHVSDFNLNRENKKRYTIRRLALKRFFLGYPPRKKEDNSIGDAINWEWLIDCANRTDKHVILVTRDTDFGIHHNNNSFLNDWLQIEFRERVSKKRKIIMTDKLSLAFKLVNIPVSKEMIDEEESIIKEKMVGAFSPSKITLTMLKELRDKFGLPEENNLNEGEIF